MPISMCSVPRCPSTAIYRGRCPTHSKAHNKDAQSANKRVYNSKRWKILRRRKLRDFPICERCNQELATDVHHRHAIQDGGDPWAMANLEALCHACHSRETRHEQLSRT